MAISTMCRACGRTYKVDDKWAGKKVKCKQCGAVMQVPGGAPARPTAARGPAPRRAEEDPFQDVDSLLALEQSGEVEEEDPQQIKAKLRALRRQAAQGPAKPVDDRIGAAVDRKKSVKKVGPQRLDYKRPDDGLLFVDEAYFKIQGEEYIDKWVPIASIGLFVLTLLSPYFMVAYGLANRPEGSTINWDAVGGFAWRWALVVLAVCVFVIGIMGGLASVGVLVGGAVMKYPKPEGVFKKCAASLSFPLMLHLLIAGIAAAAGGMSPLARARAGGGGVPLVWWFVLPLLIIGILWLLLRLRPAPFGVAAGLSMALGVGLPLLILLIIGMATGVPAGTLLAGGPRPAPARFGGGPPAPPSWASPSGPRPAGPSSPRTFPGAPPRTPPGPTSAADPQARATAEQRLKKVHDTLARYAAANGGKYPTNLRDLLAHGLTEEDLRSPWSSPWVYQYVNNPSGQATLPPQVILAYDPSIQDRQRLVLFADGRTEWIEMNTFGQAMMNSSRARAELMRAPPR